MASLRERLRNGLASAALCVASVGGGVASAAQAVVVQDGVANCVWLKVTARGSGFEVLDGDAGVGPRRSISAPCYMQLVFVPPDAQHPYKRYAAPILCPVDFENWEGTTLDASFSGRALADGNVIAVDDFLSFTNAGGDIVEGYGTHRLTITVDRKTGAFRSAIFQTLAAEMIERSVYFASPRAVVGSYTAKGISVPAAKVPAEAKALVAGGPCPP
jgi:hypothetical protein